MEEREVAPVVDWLLGAVAHGPGGTSWALKKGDYGGSVTNTAEVVIALCRAYPILSDLSRSQRVKSAVESARGFLGDAVVCDAQYEDVYKYAHTIVAEIEASRLWPPLRTETVMACWTGLKAFRDDHGSWHSHTGEGEATSLGSLVACRALVAVLGHSDALAALEADDREACARWGSDLLEFSGGLSTADGGVTEVSSKGTNGVPALTAMALYSRASSRRAAGQTVSDATTAGLARFVSANARELMASWSYRSPDSDYTVLALAYGVAALSEVLDELDDLALADYYRMVNQLLGASMKYEGVAAYMPKPTAKSASKYTWPSAYVLWALAGVPVAPREIRWAARESDAVEIDSPACSCALGVDAIQLGSRRDDGLWLCVGERKYVLLLLTILAVLAATLPILAFRLATPAFYAQIGELLGANWPLVLMRSTGRKFGYLALVSVTVATLFGFTWDAFQRDGTTGATRMWRALLAALVGTAVYLGFAMALFGLS